MDDKHPERGDVGHVDTSGVHQPDPFSRTRPDADAVGVPGETASATAAGPAPDTPITTLVEDERGTQVEYAKPAPPPRTDAPKDQTDEQRSPRGGSVKSGALTPAGEPRTPDRLEREARIPRPTVISED